ncbi:Y-family DNA polymerase [Azohydromonas australica]|uniref:Y-family DNA polymerase n=1 Tax=Azohydromonas australica TaxID=364039 RepID=UPI0004260026|nr:DNA polymerase Y family protein [Azohydromonas australica]
MLWAAACTPAPPTEGAAAAPALAALVHWALQFTPRVARVEEAVLLELRASLRLFGGAAALQARVRAEALELGAVTLSWGAPTGLAALALARAGHPGLAEDESGTVAAVFAPTPPDLFGPPVPGPAEGNAADGMPWGPDGASGALRDARPSEILLCGLLDELPLQTLSAARAHVPTLLRTGCGTLGALRQLPRGGLSRRFGAELLQALDQAYGLRPEAWRWETLPDAFELGLELPWRVEQAPALAQAARRLLLALCGWLAARQGGAVALRLRWAHDAMRSRTAGEGGELALRVAEPTRDLTFLHRLLSEHLHRTELRAPVGALQLGLLEWQPLAPDSAELLPPAQAPGEPIAQVLQRLSARLGGERVRRPLLLADHRPEWMQRWLDVHEAPPRAAALPPAQVSALPQPGFVLAQPLRLAVQGERPDYQGPLQLLAGPHRIEGGWWQRLQGEAGEHSGHVQRDYWLAWSPHAGLLWIFQTRLADDATAWYLHGCFA